LAKIALDSAMGNPISNEQTIPSGVRPEDINYKNWLADFEKKWKGVQCVLRPGKILRYNCHGLTFASRRSWIDDKEAVSRILSEDGYDEVKLVAEVMPGDVVVYFDKYGRADHSGVVVEAPGLLPIPKVVSKWAWAYEVIHWANQCPYEMQDVRYFRILRSTTKADEKNESEVIV
jgi:hypothetical protein